MATFSYMLCIFYDISEKNGLILFIFIPPSPLPTHTPRFTVSPQISLSLSKSYHILTNLNISQKQKLNVRVGLQVGQYYGGRGGTCIFLERILYLVQWSGKIPFEYLFTWKNWSQNMTRIGSCSKSQYGLLVS